jgi:DNA-binding transcriptional ArsR family regulator
VFDAVWAGIEPLVPVPVEIHPLGCHRSRSSDRDCFEVMLVLACALIFMPMVAAQDGSGTELPSLPQVDVVFDALAHEARRHIVQVLAHYGPELPSGYLAKRFTHSWPTTTRHLHVLEAAGVVSVRRDGRRCVYRLERDRLRRVIGGWLAQLDPPTSEQTWPPSGPGSVTKGNTS